MAQKGSGFFGDLDVEQEAALEEFKKRLPDNAKETDVYTCLRFLRARTFDVDKAMDMFTKDLKWRADNKVDELLSGPPMPENRMAALEALVICAHHGFDKKGRPIYIEKTGHIPVDAMLSNFTDAEMLRAHIWGQEYATFRAKQSSERLGQHVDNFCTILDLQGLSSAHKKLLDYAKPMTAVDQDHYPERLGIMCVVNCPWYFPMFWSIVSTWLDPRTRAKFMILGSDYKEKLLELIDADQLPEEYGGTCKDVLRAVDHEAALKAFEVDESTLDLQTIEVKSGAKVDQTLEGSAGSVYSWYIKTVSNDIQISVDFHPSDEKSEPTIVVHPKRFPTSEIALQGSFISKADGKLVITLDNTYSYFTSKTVKCSLSVTKPDAAAAPAAVAAAAAPQVE